MIIYLDESGDLGFDFSLSRTSHYLIMACLVCNTPQSVQAMQRAVRLTLKNKLAASYDEIKGGNTSLAVKKYFYNHLTKNNHWEIISIAADKRAWLRHHAKVPDTAAKNLFYDEIAKRLLSQINLLTNNTPIQLVVDKSKTKNAIKDFDLCISTVMRSFISDKTPFSIYHRQSYADPGLQATDMFGWGIYRKYQRNDLEWYEVFKERIALEMEFKF
ncbi:MAG TPA: DUF3800 domain-containing protein [Gammaproteobacteria bacterium]|nr:DUF3800 domain-containing protein [Gammaproteobacteria bacterium]